MWDHYLMFGDGKTTITLKHHTIHSQNGLSQLHSWHFIDIMSYHTVSCHVTIVDNDYSTLLWYHILCHIYIYILVGGFNPSEKYESIGIIIPNIYIYIYMENKSHVPNHQPVDIIYTFIWSCRTRGIPSVSWIFILDPLTARRLQKLHLLFQRLRTQRALVRDQKIHRAFIDDYVYIIL